VLRAVLFVVAELSLVMGDSKTSNEHVTALRKN